MTETEIKLRLKSAEDLARLERALPEPRSVRRQTNHYYDTPRREIQTRHRGMLRAREEEGVWRVCVKLGATLGADGTMHSTEIEVRWTPDPGWSPDDVETLWATDLEPIRKLRDELGIIGVEYLGSLENERSVHTFDDHEIELDRLTLPSGELDYELELETEDPDRIRPALEVLLKRAGVEAVPQTQTKFQRFLSGRR